MINNSKLRTAVLLAASVGYGACAQASGAVLEEIVVTAQKRAQSANDIGISVTTLSGDALKNLQVLDATDLAVAVPGLTFADTGFSVPVYTLRGVGFNDESVQATSSVGVYQDQVSIPFPIMTKGLLMDVQRVEVVKGPQGTLFGRNSTGGVIDYVTNKPTDEFEGSVSAGYSRFNTIDLTGVVSGSLTDAVKGRLAVRTVQSGDGWQESVSRNDDLGEQDKVSARAMLQIEASESVDILLSGSYWTDKSDALAPSFLQIAYQGLFGNANPIVSALLDSGDNARISTLGKEDNQLADWVSGSNNSLGGSPRLDMKNKSLSATINWTIDDQLTLTSVSSYAKFTNDSSYQADGYGGMPVDKSFGGLSALDTIAVVVRPQYAAYDTLMHGAYVNQADIKSYFQELRLAGDQDNLTWILGANYSDDKVSSVSTNLVDMNTSTNIAYYPFGGIGVQSTTNTADQSGKAWAVFGHAEWNFAPEFKLTFGLRYDRDEKDFSGCSRDSGGGDAAQYLGTLAFGAGMLPNLVPGGCITFPRDAAPGVPFDGLLVQNTLNENSTSGKIALDWMISEDVLSYVSYSRGFKSGSFPNIGATGEAQLDPVVQEQVDAYELGLKVTFAEGAGQFNTAAFYYQYDDKQLMSRVPTIFGALQALQNIPESEVQGVEFDLQWTPMSGLLLGLAGSYTDTEVTTFTGYNQFGVQQDFSGSQFPLTPKTQGTASVQYEWTIDSGMMAFFGADLSYSGSFVTDFEGPSGVDPLFELPSTTLLGARIGVRSQNGDWSATLWGRNLNDEFRPLNTRKITDGIIRYTGMPLTYGVTVGYNF